MVLEGGKDISMERIMFEAGRAGGKLGADEYLSRKYSPTPMPATHRTKVLLSLSCVLKL